MQSPVDLSSFDPASLRILERLDELEQNLLDNSGGRTNEQVASAGAHYAFSLEQLLPCSLEKLLPQVLDGSAKSLMQILRTAPRDQVNLSPSSPLSTVAELDSRSAKTLLDHFFMYVHVKNPILHEEATRRLVAGICLHGVEWTPDSCLALLVCALGACATPFGDSTDLHPGSTSYMQSQSYFQAAQKRLGLCMTVPGIIGPQCLFLAGVYSMHTFQPFSAWKFFNQALACCQEFDFVSESSTNHESAPSADEQAIYWSTWKSEQELRWTLEPRDYLLPDAPRSLYPPFFPTPPSPHHAEDATLADLESREQFSWYFYLTEISLRRLTSRMTDDMIAQLTLTTDVLQSLNDTLSERETELSAWIDALPAPMRLDNDGVADDVCNFVIRGHINNVHELLYWPFLLPYLDINGKPPLPSPAGETLKNLAEIALQRHADRIWTDRPGFRHRHHGTWPMIRNCTRSAIVLIKCHGKLELPHGWLQAVQEVLELNRYWQGESVDAYHRVPLLEQLINSISL